MFNYLFLLHIIKRTINKVLEEIIQRIVVVKSAILDFKTDVSLLTLASHLELAYSYFGLLGIATYKKVEVNNVAYIASIAIAIAQNVILVRFSYLRPWILVVEIRFS